ncbi:MAG TPA: tyrosine-protein phosphatase, partial [Candidatus Binatia bacterium]|nr:tyrosine-protein phosphatase [Candidatus Binatia bacterium]
MTITNFRDIGGHSTRDGRRVRRGLAYRSTELSRIDEADRAELEALGIRTVVDLRTSAERARWPEEDKLPRSAAYVLADVLADAPDGTPAQFIPIMHDPEAV